MYSYWLLCIKFNILNKAFPIITILQYDVYRDPSNNGEVIQDSVISITPIALFIYYTICSTLNVLSTYVNDRKFVGKYVHRGRTCEQTS